MSDPIDFTVTAREWRLRLADAPPVEGHTSGLNTAACFPERITFLAYPDGECRAVCEGPRRTASGAPGKSYVTVTVTVVTGRSTFRYPAAPAWLSEVYDRVRT